MVAMCSFQNSKLASAVGYLPIGNLSANFKGMQVLLSSCIFEQMLHLTLAVGVYLGVTAILLVRY